VRINSTESFGLTHFEPKFVHRVIHPSCGESSTKEKHFPPSFRSLFTMKTPITKLRQHDVNSESCRTPALIRERCRWHSRLENHSSLSTVNGSMRVARTAGSVHATSAITVIRTIATATCTISVAVIPNSRSAT
jgi:hypothetical protein